MSCCERVFGNISTVHLLTEGWTPDPGIKDGVAVKSVGRIHWMHDDVVFWRTWRNPVIMWKCRCPSSLVLHSFPKYTPYMWWPSITRIVLDVRSARDATSKARIEDFVRVGNTIDMISWEPVDGVITIGGLWRFAFNTSVRFTSRISILLFVLATVLIDICLSGCGTFRSCITLHCQRFCAPSASIFSRGWSIEDMVVFCSFSSNVGLIKLVNRSICSEDQFPVQIRAGACVVIKTCLKPILSCRCSADLSLYASSCWFNDVIMSLRSRRSGPKSHSWSQWSCESGFLHRRHVRAISRSSDVMDVFFALLPPWYPLS